MQFHSKTYGGSLELYDRNTCMQIHLYIIKNDAIKYFKYKCHNTYFRTFQQSYLSSYLNKLSSVLKALSLPAMPLFLPYKIKFSFSRHLGFKSQQTFFKLARAMQRLGQLSVQQEFSMQLNLAAGVERTPGRLYHLCLRVECTPFQ